MYQNALFCGRYRGASLLNEHNFQKTKISST
jgi:hypothetical protein